MPNIITVFKPQNVLRILLKLNFCHFKINNFNYETKIKSIKELKNGVILLNLIKIIMLNCKDEGVDHLTNFETDDINMRYQVLSFLIKQKFNIKIESSINMAQAQEGDEIELSMLALIILSFGAGLSVKDVVDAFDSLNTPDYELFQEFYAVVEKQKLKFPPQNIEVYEQFLFMKMDNNRKSVMQGRAEQNRDSPLSESFQGESPARKSNLNEHYLLSPLARTSLNSPRDRNSLSRKKIEETFFNEKKRLEKEILNKENLIYELNAEISDQRAEMEEVKKKMEETERKQVEFNK